MGRSSGSRDSKLVPYGHERIPGAEKRRRVARHFDRIAERYDLADLLLSFGLHLRWRRFGIRNLRLKKGSRVLDLCGGTGVFASMISRRLPFAGMSVVCDMNRSMMEAGRQSNQTPQGSRIHWVQGDAEELGFGEGFFDAVTVGFGVRNLVDLERGLREIFRVLKTGGRFMIMEFSIPPAPWLRLLYHWYLFKIMPGFGRLVTGWKEPFEYLAGSVLTFHTPERLASRLREAGFSEVRFKRLTGGVVAIYLGEK